MEPIILQNVRLSFPDLYKARQFKGEGKARFSASFLVEQGSENDKLVQKTIKAAILEKLDDQKKADAFYNKYWGQTGKCAYLSGDTSEYDGYEGMMVLSAHRNEDKGAPKVVDRQKQPLTADSGKPYGGCYVNAKVDIWIQTGDYPGIRCGLLVVQFVKDGEPFSGSVPNADDMPSLEDDLEEDLI